MSLIYVMLFYNIYIHFFFYRSDWGLSQTRIFERVIRILNWERLNRLTFVSNWNEPVLRRISLDKSARRFRTIMASISWKQKLTHWLHNTLLEVLEVNYLVAYIDILQVLFLKFKLSHRLNNFIVNTYDINMIFYSFKLFLNF